MDPQLVGELLLHVVLLYRRFEDLLYCADESCPIVDAQVDISEFPRAYALPKLEIPYLQVISTLFFGEKAREQILLLLLLLRKS